MKYSCKVVCNRQRTRKNGMVPLYVRIVIQRRKRDFSLNISWPREYFDSYTGRCIARHKNDAEADDNNIIINNELGKINKIFRHYRIADVALTLDRFTDEYRNDLRNIDFIAYCRIKAKEKLRNKEIEYTTYKNYQRTITKLQAFRKEIPFNTIDENFAVAFDRFLREDIKSKYSTGNNARWGHHKVCRMFMKRAIERDGYSCINPYKFFSISSSKGNWKAIFEEDLKKLYMYYHYKSISRSEKLILRRFLFSCSTGLRVSDLYRVRYDWYHYGIISFVPYKSRKSGKHLEIPLNNMAREMFNDAVEEKGKYAKLFDDYEEQFSNRVLKKIGDKCNISARLHHHVGRHTFITLFYNRTKDIVSAQEFAGHTKITQTMTYTHSDRKKMIEKMAPMDDILKK